MTAPDVVAIAAARRLRSAHAMAAREVARALRTHAQTLLSAIERSMEVYADWRGGYAHASATVAINSLADLALAMEGDSISIALRTVVVAHPDVIDALREIDRLRMLPATSVMFGVSDKETLARREEIRSLSAQVTAWLIRDNAEVLVR